MTNSYFTGRYDFGNSTYGTFYYKNYITSYSFYEFRLLYYDKNLYATILKSSPKLQYSFPTYPLPSSYTLNAKLYNFLVNISNSFLSNYLFGTNY